MARYSSITFEEFSQVAGRINSTGVEPSTRNIRKELGRGSMGTILAFLSKWQGNQESKKGLKPAADEQNKLNENIDTDFEGDKFDVNKIVKELVMELIDLQQFNWANVPEPNCQYDRRVQKEEFNYEAGFTLGYLKCLQMVLRNASKVPQSKLNEKLQYICTSIDHVEEMLAVENWDGVSYDFLEDEEIA